MPRQSSDYRHLPCDCDHKGHSFFNKANTIDSWCSKNRAAIYGDAHAMRAAALRLLKSPKFDHAKRCYNATKENGRWVFTGWATKSDSEE